MPLLQTRDKFEVEDEPDGDDGPSVTDSQDQGDAAPHNLHEDKGGKVGDRAAQEAYRREQGDGRGDTLYTWLQKIMSKFLAKSE